ncbi:MAG: hypothetical protein ACK2TW_04095 [Anaerolineales bacterium]
MPPPPAPGVKPPLGLDDGGRGGWLLGGGPDGGCSRRSRLGASALPPGCASLPGLRRRPRTVRLDDWSESFELKNKTSGFVNKPAKAGLKSGVRKKKAA